MSSQEKKEKKGREKKAQPATIPAVYKSCLLPLLVRPIISATAPYWPGRYPREPRPHATIFPCQFARESWLACQVINGGQCKATRGKGEKSRVALMVTPEKVPVMLSCQLQGLKPTGRGPRLYVSALVGVRIFRGNGFRVPGFARKK